MMPSSGNFTLIQLRDDFDAGGTWDLRHPRGMDRIKKFSGNISMNDFRGKVVGTSRDIAGLGNGNATGTLRHKTYPVNNGAYLPSVYNIGTDMAIKGGMSNGGYGDIWIEARNHGTISESGTYILSVVTSRVESSGHLGSQCQIAVVSSSNGFMSGTTNIDFSSFGLGNFNQPIGLTTARPYITIIGYQITKDYGQSEYKTTTYKYQNMRLYKQ
jgi:hypothetical protein